MPEIELLLKNPYRLHQLLSSKYSDISEEYENLFLDCLIENKPSHFLAQYKDILFYDHYEEYLKRFYKLDESQERVPRLAEYYKNYHTFYCRPVFREWKTTILIHNYGDNRAELFYKNNYGGGIEKKSVEKYESQNDSISSFDNKTNNKTIFDKNVRNRIDNNIITTMVFDNNISESIQGSELYTKRSTNDSLKNILVTMKVIQGPNKKKTNKNNRNYILSFKDSLYSLTKTKGSLNNNINTNSNTNQMKLNTLFLSPKLKHDFCHFKSNILEFKKAKPESKVKILITSSSSQKNSIVYRNLSQKNSLIKAKGNNKASDLKTKKYTRNNTQRTISGFSSTNTNRCNIYSNNNSKRKSNHKSITNFIEKITKSRSTYCNFISNAQKKKSSVQSQRSTSNTSKTTSIAPNIKLNTLNNNMSNSNIKSNINGNSNNNNNINGNQHMIQSSSIKKNKFQLYMNYSDSISRNKQNYNYSSTGRSKNKTTVQGRNFQGLTTCKGTTSIEERETQRSQLQNLFKELAKGKDHKPQYLVKKLDKLIKETKGLDWVKNKKILSINKINSISKDHYSHTNNNHNNNTNLYYKSNSNHNDICIYQSTKLLNAKIQVKSKSPFN